MQIDDNFAASIPFALIVIFITVLLLNSKFVLKSDFAALKIFIPLFNRITDFDVFHKIIMRGLPLIALIGVTVPLVMGLANFSILGIYLAVPMIAAPLLFKFFLNGGIADINSE
jgi:hypothetical protein